MTNPNANITPVEKQIREIIATDGPIGIDIFMQLALYEPNNGYYITKNPIGKDGDFITAPEISQMFGEMIAQWIISCWYELGTPDDFDLIEIGAGRGTLICDIARSINAIPALKNKFHINIIESNINLKAAQKAALQKIIEVEANWFNDLDNLFANNTHKPFILIGNEFLDCLPIKQFIRTDKGWCEKQVGLDADDNLIFGLSSPHEPEFGKMFTNKEVGAVFESSKPINAFVENLCLYLKERKGYALFIDYGSDNYENGDTLQSLYHHQKNHPLTHIGDADLTAHVDFMNLALLALKNGIDYEGPITQAEFLTALGINERAETLSLINPQKANSIKNDLERLIGSDQMGNMFKAFAFKSTKS